MRALEDFVAPAVEAVTEAPVESRCERWRSVLGVDYLHVPILDQGDLFLTRFGASFREQLSPENWFAPDWFAGHRQRLRGTSVIYRASTRTLRGVSLQLVVRFSRVGEPVPADTVTLNQNLHAEFNSPFEEFATVFKLRTSPPAASRPKVFTKRPLAIFTPATRLELWQTGRREGPFSLKQARHPEVELDIHRQYLLLYGWIKGVNAVEAADLMALSGTTRHTFLEETTRRAIRELEAHGFRMLDIKPQHIIVRLRPDGTLLRRRDGQLAYALVDYELLERVPLTADTRQRPALPTDE